MDVIIGSAIGSLAFVAIVSILIFYLRRPFVSETRRPVVSETRRPAPPCRTVPLDQPEPKTEGYSKFINDLYSQNLHSQNTRSKQEIQTAIANHLQGLKARIAERKIRFTIKSRRK